MSKSNIADDADARRVNSKFLMERYAISDRTVDRWLMDSKLDFPKPLRINGRRYWRLAEIVDWERARKSAAPMLRRKSAATEAA